MGGNWRRAAGLAAAASLLWAFARRADAPKPPAPAASAVPAAASRPAPRRKPAAAPVAFREARGAGLRDPGKALGGTPPERGEKAGSR